MKHRKIKQNGTIEVKSFRLRGSRSGYFPRCPQCEGCLPSGFLAPGQSVVGPGSRYFCSYCERLWIEDADGLFRNPSAVEALDFELYLIGFIRTRGRPFPRKVECYRRVKNPSEKVERLLQMALFRGLKLRTSQGRLFLIGNKKEITSALLVCLGANREEIIRRLSETAFADGKRM